MKFWYVARSLKGWQGRGLDILLGGLAVLGLAPFHLWPLAIICFVLFMSRLDYVRSQKQGGFGRGFWFGLGYFLLGTFWIGSAFIVRGPTFIPLMPPMIIGLTALLAFFWGLAGWAYARFSGSSALRWIALAAAMALAEFARGHVFGGFPWNLPGYIFESGSPVSQVAAFIGIYGLTFLVFLISAGLARTLSNTQHWITGGLSLALLLGVWTAGHLRLSKAEKAFVDGAKIRIVQVPFSQKDKFERESSIAIVNDFLRLTVEPGLSNITHVVWPEGAVVGMALENRPLLDAMGQLLISNSQTPPYWLLNTVRYEIEPDPDGSPREFYYNTSALVAFDTNGTPSVRQLNDKHRLVPFGEFIPGGRWLEKLGSKTVSTSLVSMTPAPQKSLENFTDLPPVSPQICYESIFSRLTPRPGKGSRAEWILNQSNDAWFGKSIGPAQHANIAAYRAIEEGIPLIRSASNGVSGVVDPYGRYTHRLGGQERGVLDVYLPKALSPSPLSQHNNRLLFLIILVINGISFPCSRIRKSDTAS